jgi:type III secretion protein C
MNPKVLTEDNATSEIFVGLNVPFQTQSIVNDFGTVISNNFEYRDIGVTLKVTPLISNSDIVTLDIYTEVSSLGLLSIAGGTIPVISTLNPNTQPTTRKSKSTSKVHVPNKYFLVISGLVQDQEDRDRNQIPCLGGVPGLGAFFSEKTLTDSKRNLVIFVRPEIIDTEDQINELTRHEQHLFYQKNRTKSMWKWEVEEALDLFNFKDSEECRDDWGLQQFNP